jgi:hypothetical protein
MMLHRVTGPLTGVVGVEGWPLFLWMLVGCPLHPVIVVRSSVASPLPVEHFCVYVCRLSGCCQCVNTKKKQAKTRPIP